MTHSGPVDLTLDLCSSHGDSLHTHTKLQCNITPDIEATPDNPPPKSDIEVKLINIEKLFYKKKIILNNTN